MSNDLPRIPLPQQYIRVNVKAVIPHPRTATHMFHLPAVGLVLCSLRRSHSLIIWFGLEVLSRRLDFLPPLCVVPVCLHAWYSRTDQCRASEVFQPAVKAGVE